MTIEDLNKSWISRKYPNGEIDNAMSTVSINDPEVFLQGDEADNAITEIHSYWLTNDCTQEDAFNWYVGLLSF